MTQTNYGIFVSESLRQGFRILLLSLLMGFLTSCSSGESGGDSGPDVVVVPPVVEPPVVELPVVELPVVEPPVVEPPVVVPTGPTPVPDTGKFRFRILDSNEPEFVFSAEDREVISNFMDPPIAFANSVVNLPGNDMPITMTGCGVENAFFDPNTPEIVMCLELLNLLSQQYTTILEGEDNQSELNILSTEAAYSFVLLHEIAHALDTTLDLPVAGNRESAADAIATVMAVEQGRPDFPVLAAIFFLQSGESSFGAVHPGGLDRGADVLCWTLGGDPDLATDESFGPIVSVFAESGRDCVGEYAAQQSAVFTWLPLLDNSEPVVIASRSLPQPSTGLTSLDKDTKSNLADLLVDLLADKL